jgi:hypothetical protein
LFEQVSVGGQDRENPTTEPDLDGRMGIRLFEPCSSASGEGCTVFEDPATLHLNKTRWYPSSIRISDGSIMIAGGAENNTFYNVNATNSFEFFPKKDGGVPRESAFLKRSEPVNMFPRYYPAQCSCIPR